jgi:hypothetical protein
MPDEPKWLNATMLSFGHSVRKKETARIQAMAFSVGMVEGSLGLWTAELPDGTYKSMISSQWRVYFRWDKSRTPELANNHVNGKKIKQR